MNKSFVDNEILYELAKHGDNESLEQLYRNNLGIVKKYCRSFAKNPLEFEDLQQEAYFILINCVKNFNPELGFKFISYFAYSLKYMFIRIIKKIRSKELLALNQPAGDVENDELIEFITDENVINPQEYSEKSVIKDMVQAELNKLQNGLGEAMYQFYGQGCSLEHVSSILGTSRLQTLSALNYGKRMLLKNQNLKTLYKSWFNVKEDEVLLHKKYSGGR